MRAHNLLALDNDPEGTPEPGTTEGHSDEPRVEINLDAFSQTEAKKQKLATILRVLYQNGPLSRPQLAKLTGLSVPTASSLVNALVESGMVEDLGVVAEARVGKPAAKVRINTSGNATIALDLSERDAFTGAILDLEGNVLSKERIELHGAQGAQALAVAVSLATRLQGASSAQLLGVGIAAPGLLDQDGHVRIAVRLGWKDVPLAQSIHEATGLPTYAANDVNLMALGLRRLSKRRLANAILITVDNGVGAAVLLANQTFAGPQFAAGEIGHVMIDPQGPPCACGRRGCLDALANARLLRQRLPQEGAGILETAGRAIGLALAPVMSMLNVTEVVLLGPPDILTAGYINAVRDELAVRLLPSVAAEFHLDTSLDEHQLTLQGATSRVLEGELGVR
ncbi:ROK family transcriptional regulator [Timonella senegalensis]|uniref:ROK family transcriptional regulator n=1 Tax=Timonella senegalensis TaxID=1465825 RepID=UPI0028AAFB35|nr:ROK family transcriptional regulator [Timonella senegalensis]